MEINYIVIHCSDTPDDRDVSAKDIHQWHKERGWDGIGYHYVIKRNGVIEHGRPEYWSGAHVKGHNSDSIGICLIGRLFYTKSQRHSMLSLISSLIARYPDAEVVGHYELDPNKTCPNFDVQQCMQDCRKTMGYSSE